MKKALTGPASDVTDVQAKTKPEASAAAGLDALQKEAEGIERQGQQEQSAAQKKEEQQQTDTLAHDLGDALGIAAAVAQPAMWWLTPEQFEQLWGKRVQAAIAESGAEIMRRHGVTMGDMMSKYGPYIGLAGALGPSVLATASAFKRKKQELLQQQGGSDGAGSQAG